MVVSVWPEIPHILKDNLSFPFPLLLVFLDPLILINTVHELMYTPYRLFGQRLSQIMLGRLADLESPYHHVIKVPIYLIEHLPVSVWVRFQGLPFSHGHRQRESKGRGTLLQVTNWAPNALVSSLKELIEPSLRPSNHLIVIGFRLDGNTLHIKVSFLEWTAILWLKWLTCSTRSVLPLYMVNVGWVNCWGSFPLSILWVKGDLEI